MFVFLIQGCFVSSLAPLRPPDSSVSEDAGIEPRTVADCVADPDPGSGAFLIPGSGMGKKSGSGFGIRIRDEQSRSCFREPRNHFLGLKYLDSLMQNRDPG